MWYLEPTRILLDADGRVDKYYHPLRVASITFLPLFFEGELTLGRLGAQMAERRFNLTTTSFEEERAADFTRN